jgi:type II secretory ATPase GspE/PulE/Tfp pilus assembly ATPase PilB-like protein
LPRFSATALAQALGEEMKQALRTIEKENKPLRVGDRLLAAKLVTHDQLRIALCEQKKTAERLGDILVRLGFLDEKVLVSLLSQRTGLEKIELSRNLIDPDLARRIPRDVARRCRAVPVGWNEDILVLAMADPYDVRALDEIRRYFPSSAEIAPRIASAAEIEAALDFAFGQASALEAILRDLENDAESPGEHPVIALVNELLADAARQGASDIHLEPEENFVRVRYRIDGILRSVRSLHRSHWPALSQRVKLLAGMNIADSRVVQDGRFQMNLGGRAIDFRAALLPTVTGENIVLRLLDKKNALMPLAELGFSSHATERLADILCRPHGITLVTGPTGSGKTTTLYSILKRLNTPEVHIATVEEPVEYRIEGIRQTAIAEAQGIGFASAIRAILRQDPDIIFIGEIRDRDTAQMALRAAMTGHQVYATLHCNDVWGALPRLADLGISPKILAGNLTGLVAQRLVRKLCPHCKVETPASDQEGRLLGLDHAKICVPTGCARCYESGRKGRTVIAEVLPVSSSMDDLILRDASRAEMREQAIREGFVSMQGDGIERVLAGEIALDDLARAVDLTRGRA